MDTPTIELLKIRDVWNQCCYVACADYDNPRRTQIPMRYSTGLKLSDSPLASVRRRATTIHRDNIKEVLQP